MGDLIKAYLEMAAEALAVRDSSSSERIADGYEMRASSFYMAAWMAAGYPAQSSEWPSFAVWSARETMKRAA